MQAFFATYLDFDGFFLRLRETLGVESHGYARTVTAYKAHLLEAKELEELLTSNSRAQQMKALASDSSSSNNRNNNSNFNSNSNNYGG